MRARRTAPRASSGRRPPRGRGTRSASAARGWLPAARAPLRRRIPRSSRLCRGREEARLASLVPGPVRLGELPAAHTLHLCGDDLVDQAAGILVKGGQQEALRVTRRRRGGLEALPDDAPELAVERRDGNDPVHQAHLKALLGGEVVVEERE